jgi:arsenite methyltransferase
MSHDTGPAPAPASQPLSEHAIRAAVQQRYGAAARAGLALLDEAAGTPSPGGGCCAPSCCSGTDTDSSPGSGADPITRGLYAADESPSAGALAVSLGCGNPVALAELRPGQDVLDLGSGGGLDVLLSARRVAPGGTAYGLDLTEEMLELARRNQAEAGIENARFLHGAIEQVPLPDGSVDVVISNCVVNLSPDKDRVLAEAFRVLRPEGRFAVSDIVLLRPIPEEVAAVVALWTGCVSGALLDTDYVARLEAAGFVEAQVTVTRAYDLDDVRELAAGLTEDVLPAGFDLDAAVAALVGAFASAFVRARKPVVAER